MTDAMPRLHDLSPGERLTVRIIRRLSAQWTTMQADRPAALPAPSRARAAHATMALAFQDAFGRMGHLCLPGLAVGASGAARLTATEQSFLRATAAAQHGQTPEIGAALYRVFSRPSVHARFVAAVKMLGEYLTTSGYRLPYAGSRRAPEERLVLGGACLLTMSRWHDLDIGTTRVLWPRTAPRQAAS
ncbi:hypothetical protein [Gluconacetobacter takamatsuzukensis]|uniref:Uncharacterized protein n=1 Tax=Gluconacetobacter takamatsuzukensis TaxID=1286190 RepID=A0A7W4PQC2_9PROT|nr:hypothetical protein [Gluconacetobacter takamatsuzukensis]MBB2206198.1 hypothetical protein [Gluconacetobacter takamatsuzukensis]